METENDAAPAEREVRILEVSSFSFACLVATLLGTWGLFAGLYESLTYLQAYAASDTQPILTTTAALKDILSRAGFGVLAGALPGFLLGGIVAGVYNFGSKSTGGLRVRIREE